MQLFRSIVFYLGLSALTLIFTPLSILLWPFPFALRFRVVSRWAAFNLWWLRIVCGLGFDVRGREYIPRGAAIIMCKHQSAFETLALQLLFPPHVWVLKRELFWIPIYGWGLAAMSPVAIDRASGSRALREIVRQGMERLAAGIGVVVFPEGTRVAPGARKPYQPGGGLLAAQSGYAVIPVAHNAGYFWPRNSLRKRPGCITMVIGPPIESRGRSAAEITQLTEDWIESTVQTLPAPAVSAS